jgi:hypothetical protein
MSKATTPPPWPIILAFLALAVGVFALMAQLLRYVYGWAAASFGWPPMPFWVALAAVFLIWMLTPQSKS